MAEVIIGPLLSKLQDVALKEGKALVSVSGDIDKLRDKLMWLHALVHETDLRSRHDGSRLIRVLACQTREIAFEAEDAIDKFYLRGDLSRRFRLNWRRAVVDVIVNFRTHFFVRFTLSRNIRSLNARLEEIVDNSTKYNKDGSSGNNNGNQSWRGRRYIPPTRQVWNGYTVAFKLKYRVKEKELLETRLKYNFGPTTPEVIPVAGVGGIGKRALLKHAYAYEPPEPNTTTSKLFDVRIRVRFPSAGIDESSMEQQVKEELDTACSLYKQQAKVEQVCYLVVIESPVNTLTWSKLEPKLLKMNIQAKAGSKILVPVVTSSEQEVVEGSIGLKPFVEDESKRFFNHVCGLINGRRGTNYKKKEMDEIRDCILNITGGLPLAVVLLAKLMSTMDLSKWKAAAEYISSISEDSKLQTVLSVCVDDLPDEPKSCLLFTAGFPVNQDIDAQQLVRLWMAEGFLTQHHGLETERLGQCYLNELIHRGLLQLVAAHAGDDDGGICVDRVAIHDQIHLLLRSEAQRTSFMDVHYGGCIPAPGNTRRLALHNYNNKFNALSSGLGKLRTVLSYPCHRPDPNKDSSKPKEEEEEKSELLMRDLLQGSPYLRVISFDEGIDIGKLPSGCIGGMVHLQYLGVRSQRLQTLPSSVRKLSQLQTIDVRGTQVRRLPNRVWRIKTLRHVLGDGLAYPTSTGGELKVMQTLETVTINSGVNKWKNRVVVLRSLQRLHVVGLNRSNEQALETILQDLSSLNSLSLLGDVIPINLLASAPASCLGHVVSLELHGKLLPLPLPQDVNRLCCCCSCGPSPSTSSGHYVFSRLARLVLRSTNINQDFLVAISSKMPVLNELALEEGSYQDKKLDLCTARFRSLKVLHVSGRLEQLNKIFVPAVTPGSTRKRIEPTVMDHVVVAIHTSCNYCKLEAAQHQAPSSSPTNNNPQNGGQQDGQPTNGHTKLPEEDVHQPDVQVPHPFAVIIRAAIKSNNSSKTTIAKYIRSTFGKENIVEIYLTHMVQSGELQDVELDGSYEKSSAAPTNNHQKNGGQQDGLASNGHTKLPEDGHQPDVQHAFMEIIRAAIESNKSSKAAIAEYISTTFGKDNIVESYLTHMVKSGELDVTCRNYKKYSLRPAKA